jgi:hypothetical protein
MNQKINKFGAIIPSNITQSFKQFGIEISHSEFLLILFFIGGELIEKNKEDVKNELIRICEDPENEFSEKLVTHFKSSAGDYLFDIRTYEQFYGQMCYARSIDNILTYFKDILGEVILTTPNILKSKETERIDLILSFDTIEELRIALAEKKIESLFYAGIDKIELFFQERLGIDLFKTADIKNEFNKAIKNRNTLVHNRGRITKEYLKEFPDSNLELNSLLMFSYEDISRINVILSNFVAHLDIEIANKFNLVIIENNI